MSSILGRAKRYDRPDSTSEDSMEPMESTGEIEMKEIVYDSGSLRG